MDGMYECLCACVRVHLSGQCATFLFVFVLVSCFVLVVVCPGAVPTQWCERTMSLYYHCFVVRPLLGHRLCVCCIGTLTVGRTGVSRDVGRVIDRVSWDVGWVLPYPPPWVVGRVVGRVVMGCGSGVPPPTPQQC